MTAWTIGRRFEIAAKRNGLNELKPPLRADLFERPVLTGEQMQLF